MADDDENREEETLDMRARAGLERLKIGSAPPPTKLWTGLVTHHRDIFVSHVLPKLNKTDWYFFSKVDDESRDVLEYAGVNVLALGVCVADCSSISMLELAWNVFDWGKHNQAMFCLAVAVTNKLEFLKWAREEKKCEWDEWTSTFAAQNDNLEMLKYCVDNGCPVQKDLSSIIAQLGHLNVLKFLIGEKKFEYNVRAVITGAASSGNLDMLKYLVEDKKHNDEWSYFAGFLASAGDGHLDCVKYFVETPNIMEVLRDWYAIAHARFHERHEVLNYLREKDFPEPTEEMYAEFAAREQEREAEIRVKLENIRQKILANAGIT